MKKGLLFCFCLYVLAACNPTSEPLIEGDIVKLKIECTNGETIEIDDQKTINKVIREINSSRRESTEEMEFDLSLKTVMAIVDFSTCTLAGKPLCLDIIFIQILMTSVESNYFVFQKIEGDEKCYSLLSCYQH